MAHILIFIFLLFSWGTSYNECVLLISAIYIYTRIFFNISGSLPISNIIWNLDLQFLIFSKSRRCVLLCGFIKIYSWLAFFFYTSALGTDSNFEIALYWFFRLTCDHEFDHNSVRKKWIRDFNAEKRHIF